MPEPSGITAKDVVEQEHANGLVAGCVCLCKKGDAAAWSRRQVFHVDLGDVAYKQHMCIRKKGKLLHVSFIDDPMRVKDEAIIEVDEVFPINSDGDTAPDFDYYCPGDACGALGYGKMRLSLCTATFKPGAGKENNKKDSDPVGFGANNKPPNHAGNNYVPFGDLNISSPIGTFGGSYPIAYEPIHCNAKYEILSRDIWGRPILLKVLLDLLRRGVGTEKWKQIKEVLKEASAYSPHGGGGTMASVLGGPTLLPVGHEALAGSIVHPNIETSPKSLIPGLSALPEVVRLEERSFDATSGDALGAEVIERWRRKP